MFAALDARWEPVISWRRGELDRLLDERHARIVAVTVELLRKHGWACELEVTYSWYGERGSIDILAWRAKERVALVVEVKSEIVSVEAMLRKVDEKARHTNERIAKERLGIAPSAVARLVVLPSTTTERRRVAKFDVVLSAALPMRSDAVRGWIRAPTMPMSGLLFVPVTNRGSARHGIGRRAPPVRTEIKG